MKGPWYAPHVTGLYNSVNYMLLADERRYAVYDPRTTPDNDDAGDQARLPFDDPDPTEDRPDGCECWGQEDLPCWHCFIAGYDDPNPDAHHWTPRTDDDE